MTQSNVQNPTSKIGTARWQAVRELLRVEEDAAFVGLADVEGGEELDARAVRQATDYVAGVTRQRRWLDFLLAHFYRGDYASMEPLLRQILRVGVYDLLLSHTPPHAAVNEAVEMAKRELRPGAGRLVNGILRTVQRRQDDLPQPATGDAAEDLAIRHSHPTWMVRRWLRRFGPADTKALLAHNNRRPVYGVRYHLLRITAAHFWAELRAHGVDFAPSPYLADFVRVGRVQPLLRAGLLGEGQCAVQDESAGLVVRLLDPQPGETVIDLCAAPGGKALYAATWMRGKGRLLAFDVHEGRLGLLREAARAHALSIIEAEAADVRTLPEREDLQADRVLLDAPCSGLGVLARRADLRWRRAPEDLDELTTLQDELLDAAAPLVRPGGLLVYATCTIAPEENEERVAAFLKRHPAFRHEPAQDAVPPLVRSPEGHLATLPHVHGIDGAFAVRLRRE